MDRDKAVIRILWFALGLITATTYFLIKIQG